VPAWFCATCAAGFPPSPEPPERCPICEDERQYVGWAGQAWLSAQDVAGAHRTRVDEVEPGLLGLGLDPPLAIGQRALVTGGLMWDCVPLADDAAEARLRDAGGVHTIAISHPHYYTGMADWAERLDARILLHEADREWITRPTGRVELWSGDRLAVDDDHELLRLGGHFEGGTVCLWRGGADGRGALLTGDVVQVVADRDWVSFMRSYPNLIPLPSREVARIRDALAELRFERLYGAFWHSVVAEDARAKALRSAERYITALV
jgi:hypothetical protein